MESFLGFQTFFWNMHSVAMVMRRVKTRSAPVTEPTDVYTWEVLVSEPRSLAGVARAGDSNSRELDSFLCTRIKDNYSKLIQVC